jgi:hypothetical protein
MTIQKPDENHDLRPAAAAPISARQALGLFLQVYQYPHLGNEDQREAMRLEEEARAKAADAARSPDDPSEFKMWLSILINQASQADELKTMYFAMLDDGPSSGQLDRI